MRLTIACLLCAALIVGGAAVAHAAITLDRAPDAITASAGGLEVRLEPRGGGLVLAGASADGREILRGPGRRFDLLLDTG